MSDGLPGDEMTPAGGAFVLTEMLGGSRRMAILQIAPGLLRELFQLPDGAEVIDLRVPLDCRGLLEVKIDGAGWETLEGQCIHRTTGIVTREFDSEGVELRRSINWGLPSNAKVSGAGPASAGLPGYAGDSNGEQK